MKKRFIILVFCALATVLGACVTASDPKKYEFQSSDQRVLYDLMVERCTAINERSGSRLKRIYANGSPEPDWIINNLFPNYIQYSITMRVAEVRKISIVGIDAAGSYIVNLGGQLARSSFAEVDVLYVKEGAQWKIESVSER